MNASHIAVWLLELATTPDRATTMVGDFVEESIERGRFWFWSQIGQAFVAHVGCEFTASPARLMLSLVTTPLIFFLTYVAYGIAEVRFVVNFPDTNVFVPTAIFLLINYLLLGRTVAYISGTTIAGPILCSLPFAIYSAAFAYNYSHIYPVHPALAFGASYLGVAAIFLLGAIYQRRRSLRTA